MGIFHFVLLFFLTVPLLEIYFLLKIGALIGVVPTIFTVVATAVIGAWLLRVQGFSTLQRFQASMAKGEVPAIEIVEGPILLVGGALLLTPGFFTDILGFLCLLPGTRKSMALYLMEKTLSGDLNIVKEKQEMRSKQTIEGKFKRED